MLPLRSRVDLGAMAIKGYSAFPKVRELLELHHQMILCHIQETHLGGFTLLQRSSRCILPLQTTGPAEKGFNRQGHSCYHNSYIGDDTLAFSTAKIWVAEFKNGRGNLEDDLRSGWPAAATPKENIDHVCYMVMDDWQLTINQIANAISISHDSVENILPNELGMNKASARRVPHLPSPECLSIAA